jgi:hypothetical protein
MNLKPLVFSAAVLLACLTLACQKPATPNAPSKAVPAAAVVPSSAPAPSDPLQAAVVTYLTKVRGLDLNKMSLELKNQQIHGDKATCEAAFTVKGVADMPPMEYTYELTQENGAWKVTASNPKGGGHAGAPPSGEMSPGHPGAPQNVGGLDMPPGHPPVGGASTGMPAHGSDTAAPAGHPATNPPPAPTPAK